MLKLSRLGAVMLAANPGFYHQPQTVEDVIDFIVAKILDQLGIEHQLMEKWGSVAQPHG
jgi:4-hydroxy-3-polyprenylbenzoate decarboxylase